MFLKLPVKSEILNFMQTTCRKSIGMQISEGPTRDRANLSSTRCIKNVDKDRVRRGAVAGPAAD